MRGGLLGSTRALVRLLRPGWERPRLPYRTWALDRVLPLGTLLDKQVIAFGHSIWLLYNHLRRSPKISNFRNSRPTNYALLAFTFLRSSIDSGAALVIERVTRGW